MKRCKINFFTSLDENVWLNKQHLLDVIEELSNKYKTKKPFMRELKKEIAKCERC